MMAYSDYGGYAYRDGVRVVGRSDFTITPDGGFESPGMWPGFGAIIDGMSEEEAKKISGYPSGHAVLGSGPVYVTMYKQSDISVYHNSELLFRPHVHFNYDVDDHDYHGDIDFLGYRLGFRSIEDDNYYLFAQLVEPDGTVWAGFSGYGVGCGLEDSPYHPFDTDRIDRMLKEVYPDSFKEKDDDDQNKTG